MSKTISKKITLFIILVGVVLGFGTLGVGSALADNSHHTDNTSNNTPIIPECSLTPLSGETVIYLNSKLRSDINDSLKGDLISISLAEGTYTVTLESFDNHSDKGGQNQHDEKFYIVLKSTDDLQTFVTSSSPDIPDDKDVVTAVVDTDFVVSAPVVSAQAFHAMPNSSTANSLIAVCAKFSLNSPDVDDKQNTHPTLQLVGDSVVNLHKGSTYIDVGATATDAEDGDITGSIVTANFVNINVIGEYTITYNVTDSGGLTAQEIIRTVNVVEITTTEGNSKPVITLIGNAIVNLIYGNQYVDEGATATDAEDGNITALINTDPLHTNATIAVNAPVGQYTFTYDVKDTEGLSADQAVRTINVSNANQQGGCQSACGGGGRHYDELLITNEKATSISSTTAQITWATNIPATSRVVYDTKSRGVILAKNLGYATSTPLDEDLKTSHSMQIDNLLSNTKYFFRPASKKTPATSIRTVGIEVSIAGDDIADEVASSTISSTTASLLPCGQYLTEYIKVGVQNSTNEVVKLQLFLRDKEGHSDLLISGVYDQATVRAVNAFQMKYKADILTPWDYSTPTSYVYYTTQKKINEIYCNFEREFSLDSAQLAEISAFRALQASIKVTGQLPKGVSPTDIGPVGINNNFGSSANNLAINAVSDSNTNSVKDTINVNNAQNIKDNSFTDLAVGPGFSGITGDNKDNSANALKANDIADFDMTDSTSTLLTIEATDVNTDVVKDNSLTALIFSLPAKLNLKTFEFFVILALIAIVIFGNIFTISLIMRGKKNTTDADGDINAIINNREANSFEQTTKAKKMPTDAEDTKPDKESVNNAQSKSYKNVIARQVDADSNTNNVKKVPDILQNETLKIPAQNENVALLTRTPLTATPPKHTEGSLYERIKRQESQPSAPISTTTESSTRQNDTNVNHAGNNSERTHRSKNNNRNRYDNRNFKQNRNFKKGNA